ncbi:hypothetical protein SAMN05216330_105115 [Bradyrhizobium sp. Ghvi]|uniref:hypothetical protein n=1 Tax=Bradyrhizobium sp. Ghvi TaxID=1855319 RepID=UPI0008E2C5C4|nr:hypothetical protein [Bradyrhizobium sp. Ghvi]SFO95080.1 hypothetical protein SAMN05216330_105115 [Bradyrhizobium sp. Ghvi]
MALLDDAIDASGGLARWTRLSRFTLHLSFGGMLFTEAGHAGHFKDVIAEGSTRTQSVRFTGITGGQGCASFQPDSVTIESIDGEILRTWRHPQLRLPEDAIHPLADELHLVFFCGFAIWSYLTTPFLLARPDVQVEELPPWHENGVIWHRLSARFPSDIVTHNSEQIFYFDENALQRRVDHDLLGTRVADYSWAHQTFSDIMVPTLRRSQMLQSDGTVIAKPALIDVEIFDAAFD